MSLPQPETTVVAVGPSDRNGGRKQFFESSLVDGATAAAAAHFAGNNDNPGRPRRAGHLYLPPGR